MRSLIALVFATVVSSALPARAQPAADAQQTWRLGGPRSVTPAGPGQVKEVSGVLVSDPAERAIRLDADDRDVFRVPYDRIVAMHYERAAYPRRFLRRSSFYLVVHYTDATGNPASETIRILSERDALAVGRHGRRRACAGCRRVGHWPGSVDGHGPEHHHAPSYPSLTEPPLRRASFTAYSGVPISAQPATPAASEIWTGCP